MLHVRRLKKKPSVAPKKKRSVSLLLNSSHEDLDFRLPEQNLAHVVRIDSADADVRDLDLEPDVYRVMSGAAVIITSLERQA